MASTGVDAYIAPYQRSKALAERAAWQFVQDEGDGLELSAVHPVGVIGPVLGPDDLPSLRLIRGMLNGEVTVCPPFGTPRPVNAGSPPPDPACAAAR
ncbi:Rossmann-fold NAD(P)-binding domain-containing protein [Streptomyces chartreusis]|uniref:hypothetical protein n=1 Tax=Streptomyces chartreusis TaxID=1969 RepID=UPI00363B7712